MIKRYSTRPMDGIWSDENKYSKWLDVELAVIHAREILGIFPVGTHEKIANQAKFTIEGIEAAELINEHDLLAFVEDVRSYLDPELRGFFHGLDLTSYDTEVPALAMQMSASIDVLVTALTGLIHILRSLAEKHAFTYCMGVSHGRDGEPTTFGWRLCTYIDMFEKSLVALKKVQVELEEVKCSGAMGNYMSISPELEQKVCEFLELTVRPAATQIVARDVFARFLSELAIIGGNIEKMATDLRLLAMSANAEVEEPRKEKQKGSSAMPHKRNPILLERLCGFAIMLRGYAVMGQELIRTWLERDIAHSSVERVAIPDACHVAHYALLKMTQIIGNLVVHRDRMAENIEREHGCWASGRVKSLLESKGIDPKDVYRLVQAAAFRALKERTNFLDVLWDDITNGEAMTEDGTPIKDLVSFRQLEACFDFVSQLENLKKAYARMQLNIENALPSNVS